MELESPPMAAPAAPNLPRPSSSLTRVSFPGVHWRSHSPRSPTATPPFQEGRANFPAGQLRCRLRRWYRGGVLRRLWREPGGSSAPPAACRRWYEAAIRSPPGTGGFTTVRCPTLRGRDSADPRPAGPGGQAGIYTIPASGRAALTLVADLNTPVPGGMGDPSRIWEAGDPLVGRTSW